MRVRVRVPGPGGERVARVQGQRQRQRPARQAEGAWRKWASLARRIVAAAVGPIRAVEG